MRPILRTVGVRFRVSLILAVGAGWLLASFAEAKVLRDARTGMRVKAPKGYRLSQKSGIYTVQNGMESATFLLGRSPLNLRQTVKSFRKESKIRKVRQKKKGRRFLLSGRMKGREVLVEFRPKGGATSIATYRRLRRAMLPREVAPKALFPVTEAGIRRLQRIVASRRGGRVLPLNVNVPTRLYVAPDRGSSAVVPNLPGWTFDGAGGAVSGGHPGQGAFGLGLAWPFANTAPLPPADAIVQVWPFVTNGQVAVQSVALVPGTEGWLGPGYASAMFAVRFTMFGRTWQGLFVSGSTSIGGAFVWYQSYIAVPLDGPGGIGPALMNTWASWDHTGSSQARLAQALAAVRSTPIPGNPIDPEVFDRTVKAWNDFIRQ